MVLAGMMLGIAPFLAPAIIGQNLASTDNLLVMLGSSTTRFWLPLGALRCAWMLFLQSTMWHPILQVSTDHAAPVAKLPRCLAEDIVILRVLHMVRRTPTCLAMHQEAHRGRRHGPGQRQPRDHLSPDPAPLQGVVAIHLHHCPRHLHHRSHLGRAQPRSD